MTAALTEDNNNKDSQIQRKSDDNNTSGPQSTLSNSSIEHKSKFWTTECFVDEVFLGLVQVEEIHQVNNKEIHVKKYHRQARELLKWIPIARPCPAFVVYISDLTPEINNEIVAIDSEDTLTYVLKQAVGRIFENLDFDYYHLSIARNLKVKLQK